MASSSSPPEVVSPAVQKQLGGGVQTAVLHSYGLQQAHREARAAAADSGDNRPLVLVVPSQAPGDRLYVVQASRLADLIAAGTCEGAHIVRLTRRLIRDQRDQFPGGILPGESPPTSESKDPTHGLDDRTDSIPADPDVHDAAPGGPERADDWAF